MGSLTSFFKVLCLVGTAVVTIATSKHDPNRINSQAREYYSVTTTCGGAGVQTSSIETLGNSVASPAGVTFSSFGFPTDEVRVGDGDVVGLRDNVERRCTYHRYDQSRSILHLYSCSENGVAICQITLESASN